MDNIKLLLGSAAENFSDAQIKLCYEMATAEIESYCNRLLDTELELIAQRIAAIKLQRFNTEGLTSANFSGVSESYLDGYPAEIMNVLNRKRKVKVL